MRASYIAGSILILGMALQASSGGAVPQRNNEAVDEGMIALLANPEKYDGRVILTHGFLAVEFEGDAVYLHEEDYNRGFTKNSFALRLSESQRKEFKKLNAKYVVIEGTLHANGPESSQWSGAIGEITRVEEWPIYRGKIPRKPAKK